VEKYLQSTMKLNFLYNDDWKSNHKLFLKGHNEAAQENLQKNRYYFINVINKFY
jgi:hypothetical protein